MISMVSFVCFIRDAVVFVMTAHLITRCDSVVLYINDTFTFQPLNGTPLNDHRMQNYLKAYHKHRKSTGFTLTSSFFIDILLILPKSSQYHKILVV